MNKLKLSWRKRILFPTIYLGFIIIGIGFISWAMFNIWEQFNYSNIKFSYINSTNSIDNKSEINSDSQQLNKSLYAIYPEEGDIIGSLTIPSLEQELTIFEGTSNKELKKGVGHFIQSVLPGEKDNCVLSGHRDTVFKQIGKLKIGDELIVKTSAGTFTYEINGMRIVNKDDKTVIVPTDNAVLTLTTCYPFAFIGSAPERYIISAKLIKTK